MAVTLDPMDCPASTEASALRRMFAENGAIVVRQAIEHELLATYRDELLLAIVGRLESLGIGLEKPSLENAYQNLVRVCSDGAREIFTIAKQLLAMYQCQTNPALIKIVRALSPDSLLHIAPDNCQLRIDPPNDSTRSFDWHQDYPYNMMAQSAITVWLPLLSIEKEMGLLRIVPRSHHSIRPVYYEQEYVGGAGKVQGQKVFQIADSHAELEAASIEVPELAVGDVLLFSSLLVHRSGSNVSDQSRWVLNLRYSNALDSDVLKRGWASIRIHNEPLFVNLHKNLVRHQSS